MRDPHVVKLFYRLVVDEHTTYDNPPPVEDETDAFTVRLANERLTFEMKQHFASEQEARVAADEYVRAWAVHAALTNQPGTAGFAFEKAEIIDRDPPPSGLVTGNVNVHVADAVAAAEGVVVHATRTRYTEPPGHFRLTPDADTLWHRYKGYLASHEPLLSMAYFCLTYLEWLAAKQRLRRPENNRQAAARVFHVHQEILGTLGKLTAKGDEMTARKVDWGDAPLPLTSAETAWVDAAIKAIILRVGDPTLPQVTMADLPAIE
jgi:hypothetical protein